MPTFKKIPEVVDARQYVGTLQSGHGLVLWLESNRGHGWHAHASNPRRVLVENEKREYVPAFEGDWIVHHQNGKFEVMRPQVFEETYEQV